MAQLLLELIELPNTIQLLSNGSYSVTINGYTQHGYTTFESAYQNAQLRLALTAQFNNEHCV